VQRENRKKRSNDRQAKKCKSRDARGARGLVFVTMKVRASFWFSGGRGKGFFVMVVVRRKRRKGGKDGEKAIPVGREGKTTPLHLYSRWKPKEILHQEKKKKKEEEGREVFCLGIRRPKKEMEELFSLPSLKRALLANVSGEENKKGKEAMVKRLEPEKSFLDFRNGTARQSKVQKRSLQPRRRKGGKAGGDRFARFIRRKNSNIENLAVYLPK